jgi:hypothetical protein
VAAFGSFAKSAIFVSISSYRDPELIPTVLSLVQNADNPKRLNITLGWQYDDCESIDLIRPYLKSVLDIPFTNSLGVCWTRNQIQRHYAGEDYILQLDSHHRFIKGWDTILMKGLKKLQKNIEKPLISTYLPNYDLNGKLYDELLELYQPKGYLFEKAIQFEAAEIKGSHNQRLNSQMSMWMSLQRAWDLVEQSGIEYDLIIRTRYDLFFTHQVALTCPFIENITQLDPNQLHYFKYPDHWHLSPQMNDQFAVGGYNVMKVYHNVFSSMLYYIFHDEGYKATYPDPFVNEPLIYYHLNYNNIPMNGIDHGFNGHRGLDAGAQIMR